jgi:hypothetical protein
MYPDATWERIGDQLIQRFEKPGAAGACFLLGQTILVDGEMYYISAIAPTTSTGYPAHYTWLYTITKGVCPPNIWLRYPTG